MKNLAEGRSKGSRTTLCDATVFNNYEEITHKPSEYPQPVLAHALLSRASSIQGYTRNDAV